MTASEYYSALKAKIEADPSQINGIKASFENDFTADGNGIVHMVFPGDGTYDIGPGEFPSADVKIKTKWSVMYDIVTGKMNPNVAMMMGKLKFSGNMLVAMQLTKLTSL